MGFAGTGYSSNIKLLANQKCSQFEFESKVKSFLKKNKDASFADVQPLITESFGLLFDESKKDDAMFVNKEELLKAIEKKYGDLTDDCGCSVSTDNGWEWLSVQRIVDIINDCEEYE